MTMMTMAMMSAVQFIVCSNFTPFSLGLMVRIRTAVDGRSLMAFCTRLYPVLGGSAIPFGILLLVATPHRMPDLYISLPEAGVD